MALVKICGIREVEHALAAAEAGADLIGFVFVSVRREVKPDVAVEIIESVRTQVENPPAAVGLFVNESATTINHIAREVGLNLVQLSGDELPELAGEIDLPVIKAIRLQPGSSFSEGRDLIQNHLQFSDGILIDSHVVGQWGGTGVVGDWQVAGMLATEFPVVLAGGLDPGNVSEAIQQVNPAVVDVSSGVETDGRKDSEKIRRFIDSAKQISASRHPSPASHDLMELILGNRQMPPDSYP